MHCVVSICPVTQSSGVSAGYVFQLPMLLLPAIQITGSFVPHPLGVVQYTVGPEQHWAKCLQQWLGHLSR